LLGLLVGRSQAAPWYVDQNHPSASDSNPGTEACRSKTIQRGVNAAQASDTVWVKGGVYEEAVTISKAGSAYNAARGFRWGNDQVRIGSVLRAVPLRSMAAVPGTKSWSVTLPEDQPTNLVVILDGKPIVTQQAGTPPLDANVNWATYRASDRTLMVNVGGPNPAAAHSVQLARNFTAIRCADTAKLGSSGNWSLPGGHGHRTGRHVAPGPGCFFHNTYRYGLYVQGLRHMIYRCNFRDCGYAVGGVDAGPAHIIDQWPDRALRTGLAGRYPAA